MDEVAAHLHLILWHPLSKVALLYMKIIDNQMSVAFDLGTFDSGL